jgi:hypothetical protein
LQEVLSRHQPAAPGYRDRHRGDERGPAIMRVEKVDPVGAKGAD